MFNVFTKWKIEDVLNFYITSKIGVSYLNLTILDANVIFYIFFYLL